jgi:uncharacterized protein
MIRHARRAPRRREGDSGSASGIQVSAQANASRPVPAADASKAFSATISSLRSPQSRTDEENRVPRSPMPEVTSIEEETDADILATDEEAEVDPAAAQPDAEEEHEEPAEQIADVLASTPAHGPQEPRPETASAMRQLGRPENEHRLMSTATSRAVDTAFNTLAETVFVQNGPTLEDLVKQMLRPMLKAWIDDNLPQLVERLVRAEIERVSRGRP